MNTRALKHICVLANTLNYRKAADMLFITQSTLSRSVQAVEEQYGVKLFVRDRSGVKSTSHCKKFVQHAEKILHESENLKGAMISSLYDVQKTISIGLGPLISSSIYKKILDSIDLDDTETSYKFLVRDSNILLTMILSGEIDAFISSGHGEIYNQYSINRQAIGSFPISLLVNPNHPILGMDDFDVSLDKKFPVIASSLTEIPPYTKEVLGGLIRPALYVVSEDPSFLSHLAQTTNAIWLSSTYAAAEEVKSGRLCPIQIPSDQDARFQIFAYTRRNGLLSAELRTLITRAKMAIREISHSAVA